jgi:hypothetical protein
MAVPTANMAWVCAYLAVSWLHSGRSNVQRLDIEYAVGFSVVLPSLNSWYCFSHSAFAQLYAYLAVPAVFLKSTSWTAVGIKRILWARRMVTSVYRLL